MELNVFSTLVHPSRARELAINALFLRNHDQPIIIISTAFPIFGISSVLFVTAVSTFEFLVPNGKLHIIVLALPSDDKVIRQFRSERVAVRDIDMIDVYRVSRGRHIGRSNASGTRSAIIPHRNDGEEILEFIGAGGCFVDVERVGARLERWAGGGKGEGA